MSDGFLYRLWPDRAHHCEGVKAPHRFAESGQNIGPVNLLLAVHVDLLGVVRDCVSTPFY